MRCIKLLSPLITFVGLPNLKVNVYAWTLHTKKQSLQLHGSRLILEVESKHVALDHVGAIVPILTPFSTNGDVDFGSLNNHIKFLETSGIECILCGSKISEFPLLSVEEQNQVLQFCREKFSGQIIHHLSNPELHDSPELAQNLDKKLVDIDLKLIDGIIFDLPANFYSMNNEDSKDFMRKVLEFYSVPTILHSTDVSANQIEWNNLLNLKSEFPYLIGACASTDELSYIPIYPLNQVNGKLGNYPKICALANFIPDLYVKLHIAEQNGEIELAHEIHGEIDAFKEAILYVAGSVSVPILKNLVSKTVPGYSIAPRMSNLKQKGPNLDEKLSTFWETNSAEQKIGDFLLNIGNFLVKKLDEFGEALNEFENYILESLLQQVQSFDKVLSDYLIHKKSFLSKSNYNLFLDAEHVEVNLIQDLNSSLKIAPEIMKKTIKKISEIENKDELSRSQQILHFTDAGNGSDSRFTGLQSVSNSSESNLIYDSNLPESESVGSVTNSYSYESEELCNNADELAQRSLTEVNGEKLLKECLPKDIKPVIANNDALLSANAVITELPPIEQNESVIEMTAKDININDKLTMELSKSVTETGVKDVNINDQSTKDSLLELNRSVTDIATKNTSENDKPTIELNRSVTDTEAKDISMIDELTIDSVKELNRSIADTEAKVVSMNDELTSDPSIELNSLNNNKIKFLEKASTKKFDEMVSKSYSSTSKEHEVYAMNGDNNGDTSVSFVNTVKATNGSILKFPKTELVNRNLKKDKPSNTVRELKLGIDLLSELSSADKPSIESSKKAILNDNISQVSNENEHSNHDLKLGIDLLIEPQPTVHKELNHENAVYATNKTIEKVVINPFLGPMYAGKLYQNPLLKPRFGRLPSDVDSPKKSVVTVTKSTPIRDPIRESPIKSKANVDKAINDYTRKEYEIFFASKGIYEDVDSFDWNSLRKGPDFSKEYRNQNRQ